MDLATSHLGTDLDGLAALIAIGLLEGPFEIGLPGSMDPVTTRFYGDYGGAMARLVPEAELRERLEQLAEAGGAAYGAAHTEPWTLWLELTLAAEQDLDLMIPPEQVLAACLLQFTQKA